MKSSEGSKPEMKATELDCIEFGGVSSEKSKLGTSAVQKSEVLRGALSSWISSDLQKLEEDFSDMVTWRSLMRSINSDSR